MSNLYAIIVFYEDHLLLLGVSHGINQFQMSHRSDFQSNMKQFIHSFSQGNALNDARSGRCIAAKYGWFWCQEARAGAMPINPVYPEILHTPPKTSSLVAYRSGKRMVTGTRAGSRIKTKNFKRRFLPHHKDAVKYNTNLKTKTQWYCEYMKWFCVYLIIRYWRHAKFATGRRMTIYVLK